MFAETAPCDNSSGAQENRGIVSAAGLSNHAERPDILVFGTFLIDDREFAFAVSEIKEVVNEPLRFTRVLPSPDYFRGVFNLRGFVIPVIDLRQLLGLPQDPRDRAGRKVAIIESSPHCFGLLVDATGDVFNVKHSQHHPFSYNCKNVTTSFINGVFVQDNGLSTVQILDPHKLLNCAHFPRVAASLALTTSEKKTGRRRQCLSFYIGECAFAFDMTCIKEVVDFTGIQNSSVASQWTLGTIDLRGTTVPVVDLRAFLNDSESGHGTDFVGKGFKLIVLTIGTDLLSFLVDGINTIVPFSDEDIVPLPPVGLRRGNMLRGGLTIKNESMLLLIDHGKFVADLGLLYVASGLAKVFRKQAASERSRGARNSEKTTYITFSVGTEFALDIRQVKEVLNFPGTITVPPNIPPFIEGVVNLRGDLIPIINPRRLYKLDLIEPNSTRLMILSYEGAKYGFMVDKVGSIISVSVTDAKPMDPFLGSEHCAHISNDVKEWLFVAGASSSSRALSVLDLTKVLLRSSGGSEGY